MLVGCGQEVFCIIVCLGCVKCVDIVEGEYDFWSGGQVVVVVDICENGIGVIYDG